jgi:putative DNA primase/helicase
MNNPLIIPAPLPGGAPSRKFVTSMIKGSKDKPEDSKARGEGIPSAILINVEEIKMEPVDWLWNKWLAKGKFHILAGAPEAGKTTLALSFAATISAGSYWPTGEKATAANVLIWTAEDNIADTIKPRLVQMGANQKNIQIVKGCPSPDGKEKEFNPATDMQSLAMAAHNISGGVGLLIIDPIVAAIGAKTDSHKNSETRSALQPIVDFAEKTNCAVLGISHFSKGTQGKNPTERVTGSLAFSAVARTVMIAAKNERFDREMPPRILALSKSNIGPGGGGFGFDIVAGPLAGHEKIIATKIEWLDELEGTAKEILDAVEHNDDVKESRVSKTAMAADLLKELLAAGERPQKELVAEAKNHGISKSTLWRVAEGLVRKRKDGISGGWLWSIPTFQ